MRNEAHEKLLLAMLEHSGNRHVIRMLNMQIMPLADESKWRAPLVLTAPLTDTAMPMILDAQKRMRVMTIERPVEDIRASWEKRHCTMDDLDMQMRNYEVLLKGRPYVLKLGDALGVVREEF